MFPHVFYTNGYNYVYNLKGRGWHFVVLNTLSSGSKLRETVVFIKITHHVYMFDINLSPEGVTLHSTIPLL
jgi:hypothetical protein